MRRILALILTFIAGAGTLFPQIPLWQWAIQIASPGNEQAWDLCTEPGGDLRVGGSFDGNLGVIFGLPFVTPNQKDGFIAGYSQTGNFQWALRIGGNNNDEIKGIATDASGNIYVTGYFEGTCDFDPGLFSTSNLVAAGGRDGFLAKYSPGGGLDWAVRFGTNGNDEGMKVAVTTSGVFITGYSQPSATFHSTNSTTMSTAASPAGSNYFVAHYNVSGVVQWVAGGGSSGADIGKDIVADNNRIFITGDYMTGFSAYNANGTSAATLAAQSANKPDVFVLAYNLNGTLSWAMNATSSDDVLAGGIAQDSNRLYICGSYKNGALSIPYPAPTHTIANAGGFDIYLAALTKTNGSCVWTSAQTGSAGNDEFAFVIEKQLNGHIVVGGSHKGLLTYTAVGGPSLTSSGNEDIYISAFDTDGSFAWNTGAGGGNIDSPYGLATSTTGAVYTCGEHANGVSFGSITLLNAAGKNIFVAKTGCEGVANNTITGTQTTCATTAPQTFTGSLPVAPGGGTVSYVWQQSADQTLWINAPGINTAQDYTASPLPGTSYFRRVVMATGSCTFATNVVTVTVDQPPTTAVAGNSIAVCSASASLNANVPVTGSGSWSVVSGSALLSSTNSANAVAGNLPVGNTILAWSITNGVCAPSTSTMLIRRDAPPSPLNAGAGQTVCASGATLSASVPTVGTGQWSLLSGQASLSSSNTASTAVTGLGTGTNVFVWTITNGVCPAATATVIIQRDAQPGPASAGNSQTLCATAATLTASSPTTGTGSWILLSGTATIATPLSTLTAVSSLQAGPNVFLWQVQNGVCAPANSTVIVHRDVPPSAASAGSDQSVCGGSATLSANVPAMGTGSWSLVSGTASIISPTNPQSPVSSLVPGASVFEWKIQNGTCPPSTDQVTVTSYAPPSAATAGGNQTVCAAAATLAATVPATGSGSWSAQGSALITSPLNATTAVTGLSVGINTFVWTISNGVCSPNSGTVNVLRLAAPGPALAGSDQVLCSGNAILAAGTVTAGTGSWSLSAGQATIASPGNGTTAVTVDTGTNTFVFTVTSGICAAVSDTVTVIRDAMPDAAIAGPDYTVCATGATINANVPGTGQGMWTVTAGNATVASAVTATTTVAGLDFGINTFVWTITNGVCPASTATMTVIRDQPPSQPIPGSDQVVCADSTVLLGNVPVTGSPLWQLVSGSGILTNPSSATTIVSGLAPGANVFVYSVSNGVCPAASATMEVIRDLPPAPVSAGQDQTICAVTASVAALQPTTGAGSWLASGGQTFQNPASAATTVSNLSAGINTIIWSVINGVCPVLHDTVVVFREQEPSDPDAGNNTHVCTSTHTIQANAPAHGTASWHVVSGPGQVSSPASTLSTISNLSYGENSIAWVIINGTCPSKADTVIITRDTEPDAAIVPDGFSICGFTTHVTGNTPVNGTPYWSVATGDADLQHAGTSATVNARSEGKLQLLYSISNGVCVPETDTVALDVFFPPGPADAGGDTLTCSPAFQLAARTPTAGTGLWTVVSGGGNILSPHMPVTDVTEIPPGVSLLRWTLSNGICPVISDEVEVTRDTLRELARAGPDIETERLSVQLDAGISKWPGKWELISGAGNFVDPQDPKTMVTGLVSGENRFRWTVSQGNCGSTSDDVIVNVQAFMIPNGFSPNGDGSNDLFYITGLENYYPVRLTIFSRWGTMVYESRDYRNQWDGSNSRGEPLADDTYYYVLEIEGMTNTTGFITLKRR